MNIFKKQSLGNSTFNLCVCMWNLTRCKETSFLSSYLNIGKFLCQSNLGILFGKPGMWSQLMGAYLLATFFILKILEATDLHAVESPWSVDFLDPSVNGVVGWMVQPSYVSNSCSPSTIRFKYFSFFPREDLSFRIPSNGTSMLSLHQIPKAEEGNPTEVTKNQDFELIASPIKLERALSKGSQPWGM